MVEVGVLPHDDDLVQLLRRKEQKEMVTQVKCVDGEFIETSEDERREQLEKYHIGAFSFTEGEIEVIDRYFPKDKTCNWTATIVRYSDLHPKSVGIHRDMDGDASKMALLVYLENTKEGGELRLHGNGEEPVHVSASRVIDTRPTDKGLVYVKFAANEWHKALDIAPGGVKLVVVLTAFPR